MKPETMRKIAGKIKAAHPIAEGSTPRQITPEQQRAANLQARLLAKASKKDARGGARKGAGRKRKYAEAVVTRAINLPPTVWQRMDTLRGPLTESEWVFAQIIKQDLKP